MERVAIITGASRGIGRAAAVRLARDFSVLALVARTRETLEETAETVRAEGAKPLLLVHDLCQPDAAGAVVAATYRSGIFYTDDSQRTIAEETIADVEASGLWSGKVVTEVSPLRDFQEAVPEHQDYLERIPHGYTCHFILPDWKLAEWFGD